MVRSEWEDLFDVEIVDPRDLVPSFGTARRGLIVWPFLSRDVLLRSLATVV